MDKKKVEEVYSNTYFKINEILLIATGLWPYRNRNEKLVRRVIVFVVMFVGLFPNVNAVRIWCGVDFCLCGENIVGSLYSIVVILKYYVTILSESKILNVHKQVAMNWISITDAHERSILTYYAKHGKIMSIGYIGIDHDGFVLKFHNTGYKLLYMTSAGFAFSQATILPVVLDLILPLNESRKKILIVRAEYFIDPFEYYYQLYIYYSIATIVSVSVLMSIDTTYSTVVHQNLGYLSIVKHRLHVATKHQHENNDIVYKSIVKAIQLHKISLHFVDLIESSYSVSILILIGCFIVALSLGTVITMEYIGKTFEVIRFTMMEIGILILMFYLNYPGQQILDHSSDVFVQSYMNEWYFIPQKAKMLIRIMMLRCLKHSALTAGKLYVLSYQSYGNIIKTTLSYVTVIASMKN